MIAKRTTATACRLFVFCLALPLAGCAFFGKAAPLDVRYFTLDEGSPQSRPAATAPGVAAGKKLRLGSVTAAAHLRERLVFRDSPVELGYHELSRWSERPDAYVRRGISRALYQERGVEQVLSGGGHVLDVDLLSLDEFKGDASKVRVTLAIALHDDVHVVLENQITVEKPIAKSGDMVSTVEAFRDALREAIGQAADQTVAKLEITPDPPPSADRVEGASALQDGGATSNANDNCATLKGAELAKCRKKQLDPKASPKAH